MIEIYGGLPNALMPLCAYAASALQSDQFGLSHVDKIACRAIKVEPSSLKQSHWNCDGELLPQADLDADVGARSLASHAMLSSTVLQAMFPLLLSKFSSK